MPRRPEKTAAAFVPANSRARRSASAMKKAVDACRGCDLYKNATQGVYGEGSSKARILLIGEQPGNQEDLAGHPFVGPAGRILDEALEAAGIDRKEAFVTNAVKHFKWKPVGKRRLHQRPSTAEVHACRPWLESEVELLMPDVIVCLGATAAQAVFDRKMPVLANRGRFLESPWSTHTLITLHPSAILRIEDPESRHQEFRRFVSDLRLAARTLGPRSPRARE